MRGIQRLSRLTSGVSANATRVPSTSIRMALVTWLSSQPATTMMASHARITSGTSSARTRRGCAGKPINAFSVGARRPSPSRGYRGHGMHSSSPTCWGRWREAPEEPEDTTSLPPPLAGEVARSAGGRALLRSVRRLRADEEEIAHEEDEESVLDHDVTGQRLLHRVPDDAAVDVP